MMIIYDRFYSCPILDGQCIVAENALGLPQLAPQAQLADYRRQIAMKIGVKI